MQSIKTTKQGSGLFPENPLTEEELEGIVLAIRSVFKKLSILYEKVTPIFEDFGFKPPSAGVVARDLSEKIETGILQHCATFQKGTGFADLERQGERWEVKICKTFGLTINQSSTVDNENYIVVNYKGSSEITKIWILWHAKDEFFSERKRNSNARTVMKEKARSHIQGVYPELEQPELKMQGQASKGDRNPQSKRKSTKKAL